MARLTPLFSASRAVRDYSEQHYLLAAKAYRGRAADQGAVGRQMVEWHRLLERKWASLRFGDVKVETRGEQHVFEAQVFLDDLDPKGVALELYADAVAGSPLVRQEMKCLRPLVGAAGGYFYVATVSAARPPTAYTARLIPRCDGVAIPLECAHILWNR